MAALAYSKDYQTTGISISKSYPYPYPYPNPYNGTTSSVGSFEDLIGLPINPETLKKLNIIIQDYSTIGLATGLLERTETGTTSVSMYETGNIISSGGTSGEGLYATGNSSGYGINFSVNGSGYFDIDTANGAIRINGTKEYGKEVQRIAKRREIRKNLYVPVKYRVTSYSKVPENEQIAMDTLRESITEEEFRKYIKFGFILVKGQEGKTYQVFKNRSHTKVWKNDKVIEEICIHIKDYNIPPTDSVIAFRTMIKTSEEYFKKMGNVYKMREGVAA